MSSVVIAMLSLGMAVSVDTAGAFKAKQDMQGILDISLLAAVTTTEGARNQGQNNQIDWSGITHDYMLANGYPVTAPAPTVQVQGGFLTANLTTQYETSFGGLLGMNEMDVSVGSQVTLRGGSTVQVALVLDNTESMNPNGKMTALKEGATALVDAIEDGGSGSNIALVPFARYVRVDMDFEGSSWLDVPDYYEVERVWEQATHTGGTCTEETRTRMVDGMEVEYQHTACEGQTTTYETQSRMVEGEWDGCVGVRDQPLDTLDGNYSVQVPGLRRHDRKEVTGLNSDTNVYCPREITPLTDNYSELRSEIQELYGTDITYLPIGLTWGQRVLSPGIPYDQASTDDGIRNIMVIMSDGMNTAEIRDTAETRADYEAPPWIYHASDGEAVPYANTMTASLCEQIKSEGTEIYTIAFQIDDPATKALVTNCASSGSHAYDAGSNAALVTAFENIAESLESEIRLSR